MSCREITDGASIDVIEMDAATHTGVDNVRDLQDLLRYRPTRDRYRVMIVDEVHMLSKGAFNALLKTIEEPPPYLVWVFATTERAKVPDTILSRCQQLEFRPVSTDLIRGRLQAIAESDGFSLSPSAAVAIAGAAEGSVRDALSLLDQLRAFAADEVDDTAVAAVLGVPPLEVTAQLLNALASGRLAEGLGGLRQQLAGGQDPTVLYQETGRTLRTLFYLAMDPALEPTLSDAHRSLLQPIADAFGVDGLGRMLGLWVEQERLVHDASNRELALEVASLRLARWPAVRLVEEWLEGGAELAPTGGSGSNSPSAPPASFGNETGGGPAGPGGGASSKSAAAPAESGEEAQATSETGSGDTDRDEALEEVVRSDPGVELATRILGGEVVAVRPHGEGS